MQKIGLVFIFLLFTILVKQSSQAQVYCAPTFANGCSTWNTSSISLSNLNWTAPTACTTWDFTNTTINMMPNVSTAMTVSNANYCGVSVWVDVNADGDFDDIGENLYTLYTANASNNYMFNIILPASTVIGNTRLRVISSWGSNGTSSSNGQGPCGAYQYGNYQDFTLNVGGSNSCSAPNGLTSNMITATSANVSWNAFSGAVGYEYLVNTTSAIPTGAGTPITSTSVAPTGLTAATTYYVHLRTDCGSSNYSAWSLDSFTTLSVCNAPLSLTSSNILSTSASFSWAPVLGALGYEYMIDNLSSAPIVAGTPTTTTTYNASSLTPSTSYYMHVRTECDSNNFSTWTTIPFNTLAFCDTSLNIQVQNITATTADFNWTTVTNAIGYEYVLDNVATSPSGVGTPISSTFYAASTLTPNTVYYMHVRTNCDSSNYSSWKTISFTTANAASINQLGTSSLHLLVYPNPVKDFMYIDLNELEPNGQLEIKSIDGKLYGSILITEKDYVINTHTWPSGIYFVTFKSKKGSTTIKLIKD